MIRFRALLFLLFTASAAQAAVKVQPLTSPGGISIWFVEQRGLPIVNIEAAIRGGRALEPKGKEGVATLVSYLLDEGAGDLTSQAFMAALADRSISFGVAANAENFAVSLSFLTEHKSDALRLGALALTKPRFDPVPVKQMKDAILVDQKQVEDSPESKAALAWWERAFPGTDYGRNGLGTAASVSALTRTDLAAFHARSLAKSRLLVVIVGDMDAKSAAAAADALFGGLPKGEPDAEPVPLAIAGPGSVTILRDVPQSVVVFGLPAIKRNHPDFRALHTLNYILGSDGFSSRLMQELRVKRGLVYGVSTSLTTLRRSGVIYGSFATKNETAGDALNLVKAEFTRMRNEGPTKDEIAAAKAYLTGAWPLAFDSNATIASQLLSFRLDDLPPNYGDQRNAEIEALTADNLKRVAQTYMDPSKMFTIVLGQPKGLAKQ
jgi:zinc protease